MSRRVSTALLALTAVLALAGCGWFDFEEREAWRGQAEAQCLRERRVEPSAYMSLRPAINGPGICGMDHPLQVTALSGGAVSLRQDAVLNCPTVAATQDWLDAVVQPAAMLHLGARVTEIHSGSYACRTRNSQRGARKSEHAFGNAVDVMSFTLEDGRTITVARGWRGAPQERDFLREAFVGACGIFTTVLGPGSDAFHHDHLHLDLARHDARGERRVCRPQIDFRSRLDEIPVAQTPAARTPSPLPDAPRAGTLPTDPLRRALGVIGLY